MTTSRRILQQTIAVAICSVSCTACKETPGPAPVSPVNARASVPRGCSEGLALPSVGIEGTDRFAKLAGALADPLLSQADAPARAPGMDEVYAAADAKLLEYRGLSSAPPKIAALAAEAAEAQSEFLAAHRALNSASDGSGEALLLCIGLLASNAELAFKGLQGAVHANQSQSQLEREYAAAFLRNRGAQLCLAALAPEFAGPPAPAGTLWIDIDESWHGITVPYDVFKIRNDSGRTLTNCVVSVELTGAAGDKKRNVHFIPAWPPGAVKLARYGMGVSVGGQQVGQQTVYSIEYATVSIWSPELRAEGIRYDYAGDQRDTDIREQVEGKLKLNFRLYDDGIVNIVPAVSLTLDGVSAIPENTITLEFHHGSDIVTRSWSGMMSSKFDYVDPATLSKDQQRNLRTWHRGETRSCVPSPRLPWMPDWAQISISFPDTKYVWSRKLDFHPPKKAASPLAKPADSRH